MVSWSDYSEEAVFFRLWGGSAGPNAIETVFDELFTEFAKPGASVELKQRVIEGDYASVIWSAETADNSYELASDTFVIQSGGIRM